MPKSSVVLVMHLVMIKTDGGGVFRVDKILTKNNLAKELSKRKYRQRVKPSRKTYSREKQKQLKAEDLQNLVARSSNT